MANIAVSNEQVLPDVHSQPDERQIAIDQVGVSEVRFPITVLDRDGEKQNTVARLNMSVDLSHESAIVI